ncbi:MAG: class I SAM-dependent methyltransferase [Actinomycetia bacterium]|nr:class I SAM-dependent methyltransferase [Actinomycetes bacterium]
MIGTEARSARFWDRRAATYNKTEVDNQQLQRTILERSLEYLGSDDITLDYGCGTGALSFEIAPHVKVLHGLDISPRMVEIARDRADGYELENLRFSAASIFTDTLQPESFDVIFTSQVLHVMRDRDEALHRIYELVRPGGWFLSTTPCMPKGQSVMKVANRALSMASAVRAISYMKFSSVDDLERSISEAGFEIHETADLQFDQRSDMRHVFARFVAARKIP